MRSSLVILRQTPQLPPLRFLSAHTGCWIQYYDDTPAQDPAKALSTPSFNLAVARRKQLERCAVCFSLQAFGNARTKEEILCFRNLGVDIDLVSASERPVLSLQEIDRRKEEYLRCFLVPFPLEPHWVIETRHGFHVLFRLQPQRTEAGIQEAETLNRRLVSLLRGDENAALLTQVLRVPCTYQFKDPTHPFLCRLLLNNARTIPPYDLAVVRSVLDAWEVFHARGATAEPKQAAQGARETRPVTKWQDGLAGVPEGQRNTMAASIIGGILCRVPEELWETAGWGGLREWNSRNAIPLPDCELRTVFESIARRERARRQRGGRGEVSQFPAHIVVRVDVRVERRTATEPDGSAIAESASKAESLPSPLRPPC